MLNGIELSFEVLERQFRIRALAHTREMAREISRTFLIACVGCSPSAALQPSTDAWNDGDAADESAADALAEQGSCKTTIAYGASWIHPPNHPDRFDVVDGSVSWDGTCTADGASSYALLSNGWKPYFQGRGCIIALDQSCAPQTCATRVAYGAAWLPPPNHPDAFDDVGGRMFSDGACTNTGADSYADLSNGWQPHFKGNNACELSFRYEECGGLYENPVIPFDCPDPGVLRDGSQWVLACTSGNAANAFPIFVSSDLVHWSANGHIFPAGKRPNWALSDF